MASKTALSKRCKTVDADYLGGHKLRLHFNDGLEGDVDLSEFVKEGVFKPLCDPRQFTQFGLIYGTIVWKPNGMELDIAPEYLYQRVFNAASNQKTHGFPYFNADSWQPDCL